MYNFAQLLNKLPFLPEETGKRLMQSTIIGTKAYLTGDPVVLADTEFSMWGNKTRPDRDVDLMRSNFSRRKLLSFTARNEDFRKSLNKDLSGGESYPVLTTLLGIGAGLVSGGAGLLWTGFTTAISLSVDPQPVQARQGDEIHQVEMIGRTVSSIYHLELIILVDPYRVNRTNKNQWVIHEERNLMEFS